MFILMRGGRRGFSGKVLTVGLLGNMLILTKGLEVVVKTLLSFGVSSMISVILAMSLASLSEISLSLSLRTLATSATTAISFRVMVKPELLIILPIIWTSLWDKESPNLELISATTLTSFSVSTSSAVRVNSAMVSISPGVMSSDAFITISVNSLTSSITNLSGSASIKI